MSREEEKELYEAIKKHDRSKGGDCYGSSGAYIKAALRNFHHKEQAYELQEQWQNAMKEQMERLAAEQTKAFLTALEEHDEKLVTMVSQAVQDVIARDKMSGVVIPDTVEETMPEEAMAYLASL